mgnify:CR=1 FL=1
MTQKSLPAAPAKAFLVGIGGIGMSSLAQYLAHRGYQVSGSDRDLTTPSQQRLFQKLSLQNIKVYPQDGSGPKEEQADFIVYSSAIEEDNPDFLAAGEIPRIHRSVALSEAIQNDQGKAIAVAGSSGKTSTTAWVASALHAAGFQATVINGGFIKEFRDETYPGNFYPGKDYIIFEADESDGSLVNYHSEVAILLNCGDDHHSKDKLHEMFKTFLGKSQKIVINEDLKEIAPQGTPLIAFAEGSANEQDTLFASDLSYTDNGLSFQLNATDRVQTAQWGKHNAYNALAVIATLKHLGISSQKAIDSVNSFRGVERRFDFKGRFDERAVYDDYAHNPQKIAAALRTAQDIQPETPLTAIFQPHGYGPLGFMRESLKQEITAALRPQDEFIFLPVFYAGGTTSFKPQAKEVAEEYSETLNCRYCDSREELADYLISLQRESLILTLGARDPSLSDWSETLVELKKAQSV